MAVDDSHLAVPNTRPMQGITIQTPSGPHRIPDYAKCYCTSRHTPKYMHTLPYELPDGKIMYFCPATHHALTLLMQLVDQYGWEDLPKDLRKQFTQPVKRMAHLIVRIQQYGIPAERYLRVWAIKKLEQDGEL